ncbi:hypothetical protein FPOAC2_01526 [Fusarium poae]|jgi:hypothetical protein
MFVCLASCLLAGVRNEWPTFVDLIYFQLYTATLYRPGTLVWASTDLPAYIGSARQFAFIVVFETFFFSFYKERGICMPTSASLVILFALSASHHLCKQGEDLLDCPLYFSC